MKALIASILRWAAGTQPDDRFWVQRPDVSRGWAIGDLAECRIDLGAGWGPVGALIPGPRSGDIHRVVDVVTARGVDSISGQMGTPQTALRFDRWPYQYGAMWFRRVTPKADALQPATAEFQLLAEVLAERQVIGPHEQKGERG